MRVCLMLLVACILAVPAEAFAKVIKRYYPNGKLEASISYNEANQMDGASKYYWPNGRLRSKAKYQRGIVVGAQREYDRDGRLRKVVSR